MIPGDLCPKFHRGSWYVSFVLVYDPRMPQTGSRHIVAEVSTAAVARNLDHLHELVGPGTQVWPVVKADAYGLGLEALWPVIAQRSEGLCVATVAEALELRGWGYGGRLLVFFPPSAIESTAGARSDVLEALAGARVDLTVCSIEDVADVRLAATKVGLTSRVHLKVDTGMNRNGSRLESAAEVLNAALAADGLEVTGLYSHLATAEGPDFGFVTRQLDTFTRWVEREVPEPRPTLHIANSSAALGFKECHLGMIRPGLGTFGYFASNHVARTVELAPALTLVTHLMLTKTVQAGETCGYGRHFRFDQETRVGIVPVGYADGYLKSLSSPAQSAHMRVGGSFVPVRGAISMDQTILDLTEMPDARVGDEVEVIGRDSDAVNSVESLAALAGSSPYELLSRLGHRIERRLVD